MTRLRVSVVIPTRNRADDLLRCLDSLMKQNASPDEICIIDNGSTDGTLAMLERYPVRVLCAPGVALSRLFNLGWQSTHAEFVAYLNDDTEVVPEWLGRIEQTFAEFPQAAVVGGPTVAMREQEIYRTYQALIRTRGLAWLARFYDNFIHEGRLFDVGEYSEGGAYSIGGSLRECLKRTQPYPVTLLSITNMVIRRTALEAMGGFDESFHYAHIDGDLFLRLRKAGYILVFDPKAVAWHYVNPTGLTRSAYVLGRDLAHLYRKHPPPHSATGWLRFSANIVFLNLFWIYKALTTRRLGALAGINGFVAGALGR